MFKSMNIAFQVIAAGIDERRLDGENPVAFAKRAAREKGTAVDRKLAREGRNPFVVSADTVVVLDGNVLLKPRDMQEAEEMLTRLSGRTHSVITGWSVGRDQKILHEDHAETAVTFHEVTQEQIAGYVATREGMDKAGAYAIQGIGAFMVDRIEGNYHNVVGLPISHVIRTLVQLGAIPGFPMP